MQQPSGYSDWDEFDPEEYAWRCYGPRILDIDQGLIQGVIDTIEKLDIQPGAWQKVADIGPGPNLYPAMLFAPFVAPKKAGGQIDLIELSKPNRTYLQQAIAGKGCPTRLVGIWDKYEDFMASVSVKWQHALQRTQDVAVVAEGDVYQLPYEAYDAISAYFVAESITDSRESCELAITKLIDAVKPGGLVTVGHMLGSTGYYAGQNTSFPAVPLTVDDLRRIYSDRLESLTIVVPPAVPELREDYHGAAVVVGKKLNRRSSMQPTSNTTDDTDKPFTSYDTQACLYDEQRVEYLRQAIFEVVKQGDVVVDGGSGTGVLGMLAAQAGASRVYCAEINPEYIQIILQNAKNNGLADKIIVIPGDATKVDVPEPVDVVVSEVISGGFFYEPQLQILSNLRRFLKPGGVIIPQAMDNYLELIDAQDEFYGLKFNYDTRHITLKDTALTTKAKYLATSFYEESSFSILANATVRAMTSSKANALRTPYSIQFSPGVAANKPTEFLLNPQVIFLPQPVELKAGAYYNVALAYEASSSPLTCRIAIKQIGRGV